MSFERCSGGPLKVLAVIASYGEKNLPWLQEIIRTYQAMNLDVELVVTTEAPKSVELGVKTLVGTPTSNPRSLPFAHKKIFADNVDLYDLYVYTEDDIHVSEDSLRAFLALDRCLAPDEIAGFVRFELTPDGTRFVSDAHGPFRWDTSSVRRRGNVLVAEFTNKHSGFYVLTNAQLRKALESSRFLSGPYEGRYEMLESAATDIYVNYGFRKVLCISALDSFLIHHLPNRYIGQMGISMDVFRDQIQALSEIYVGSRPATTLCEIEPRVLQIRCSKTYDEKPSRELLEAVPDGACTVLSIGSGFGATEYELRARGARVTAFPLDSVVGATLGRHGLEVICGSLDTCFDLTHPRRFDCVLMTNLVHLLPDHEAVVERCTLLLEPGGLLVIEGRNFDHLPTFIKRVAGVGDYGRLRHFDDAGIHPVGPGALLRIMRRAGLEQTSVTWHDRGWPWPLGDLARHSDRLGARSWIVTGQRRHPQPCVEHGSLAMSSERRR